MVRNSGAWQVVLDGVRLSGGEAATGVGCLTSAPDGMGLPPLRTEDVAYPQRDGVKHFSDWYEPRIITLEDVWVCNDGCPGCPTGRQKVRDISTAWGRKCDDAELVIFTDCEPGDTIEDRALNGPFGVVGRPRVADTTWFSQVGCASMLLRFDSTDQRMFILDADGTPGSGEECVTLDPNNTTRCRTYPRCYPLCYTESASGTGPGPVDATVYGNMCAYPTITLYGALTSPRIENLSTGQSLTYNATINDGDEPVVIDTFSGTATQGGQSRTGLLTGTRRLLMGVGTNTLRLASFASGDNGYAEVCWRPSVDSA